jgi:hypothetical protein
MAASLPRHCRHAAATRIGRPQGPPGADRRIDSKRSLGTLLLAGTGSKINCHSTGNWVSSEYENWRRVQGLNPRTVFTARAPGGINPAFYPLTISLKYGQRVGARWLFFCATFQTRQALAESKSITTSA